MSFLGLSLNLFALEYGIVKRTTLGGGYAEFGDIALGGGINASDFDVKFSGILEKGWMGYVAFNKIFSLSLGYSFGAGTIFSEEKTDKIVVGDQSIELSGSINSSSVYQDISLQLDTGLPLNDIFTLYVPVILFYRSSFYSSLTTNSYNIGTEARNESKHDGGDRSFGSDIGLGTLIHINTDNEFLTKIKLNHVSFRMQASYPLALFYFESSSWVYSDSIWGKMRFTLDTIISF